MKKVIMIVCTVAALAMLSTSALAETVHAKLEGFNVVPAVSTRGSGEFRAKINAANLAIEYELSYEALEGVATAALIHLGQESVNGGVIAFLCGVAKPACPLSGTVTGTIIPADIVGPEPQGIAAGEFEEAVAAVRAGVTYVSVHTALHPAGEIRGQIK